MTNPTCPHCHSPRQLIRSGYNPSRSQRDLSQACHRCFTPQPKPRGHDQATRDFALKLYLEGNSQRAIARLLHLNHQSVANWLAQAVAQLPSQVADQSPAHDVETPELFTFVAQKQQVYVVIGLDRESHLIVSCAGMAQRSPQAMQEFADQLPAARRYCSDGLALYPELVYPKGGPHVA